MKPAGGRSVPRTFLWLLLALFVAKGFVTALAFPAFSGHDEVAHYAYLRILAEEGRVPVIPDLETWRAEYDEFGSDAEWDRMPEGLYEYAHQRGNILTYTTEDWFGGEDSPVWTISYDTGFYPSGWIYTGNHPPLFYTLMLPVYYLVQGFELEQQLLFFRLATIPFGMITIVLAYLTVRTLFPRDKFLAMTVPAFVAFQPQIAYESVMLNNDILAIMLTSAVVWMLALGLRRRFPWWTCMWIGVFLGLAVLAKSTSIIVAFLVLISMLFGIGIRRWQQWLAKGALTAGISGLLVFPWFLYMMVQYGDPTALGKVEDLQYWNYSGGSNPTIWEMVSNRWFHWERLKETWGAFGWRRIQFDMYGDGTLLRVILWITLFAVAGLGIYAIRFLREQREMISAEEEGLNFKEILENRDGTLAILPWQVTGILTMGVACVIGYYAVLQFGTSFALTQARYYFPMIVPAAILFMLGFRSWFPQKWLSYVGAFVFLGLVALNIIIYSAYVVPFWPGFTDAPPLP